jgi:hypothetical protein
MTTAPRSLRLTAASLLIAALGFTSLTPAPASAALKPSEGQIFLSCRNAQNTEVARIKLISGYPTTVGRYDQITYPRITVTTPGSSAKVKGTVAMYIDSLRPHSKKSFTVTPGTESRLNWKVRVLSAYSPAASIGASVTVGKIKADCQAD